MEFKDEALTAVAREAMRRKTGARGLRAILEDVMLNVMYDIPSRNDITKCVITKEVIEKKEDPILVTEDRKKKSETA